MHCVVQEGIDDLRKACFASRMAVPPALYHCAGLLHSNRLAPRPAPPVHTNGASGPPCAASTPNPQLHHLRFPAADCQLSPAQLRGMRAGLAATLDALMVRLAPCLHGGASDRATDTLAAAFVAQRLPPSWLPEPPEDLEGEEPDAEDMAEVRAMRCAHLSCLQTLSLSAGAHLVHTHAWAIHPSAQSQRCLRGMLQPGSPELLWGASVAASQAWSSGHVIGSALLGVKPTIPAKQNGHTTTPGAAGQSAST